MAYWLMKSEPNTYSIHDLEREGETVWDGVRNYQARNFLRLMQPGDLAFFYHSNTEPPGIVGWMEVREGDVVDPSQFLPASPYYDPQSKPQAPRWQTVRVGFGGIFANLVSLAALRQHFKPEELLVVRPGNRLSVLPVGAAAAERIFSLGGVQSPPAAN